MVGGKLIRESLGTRKKEEAEDLRAEKMKPLVLADKASALAVIGRRLDDARAEQEQAEVKANPPTTLADAWTAYMESEHRSHRAGESTLSHYEGHLEAFIEWLKKNRPAVVYMREVTPEDAAGFIRYLGKKGYSGNRINKHLQFLKTLFRVLKKSARLTINPFEDISRREQRPNGKRPFTIEELKRIIETAQGELQTLFMVGTFTGLRLADAATLRWDETDLHRRIIRRIPRKTVRTGEAVILGIPAILLQHLESLQRRGPFVMPEMVARYERDPTAITKTIQTHLEKCGIQTVKPGTGFETVKGEDGKPVQRYTGKRAVVLAGFHSLRHTFVSLHAQAGTPQAILQKLAGHGNPMMTEHYTHIDERTARTTAAAFPAIVGDSRKPKALEGLSRDEQLRRILKSMTAKTLKHKKALALAILEGKA